MKYIATCFSHFGAMRMKRLCEDARWPARLMPVPRALSSSCGICVEYEGKQICPTEQIPAEVEKIVSVPDQEDEAYVILYTAEGI